MNKTNKFLNELKTLLDKYGVEISANYDQWNDIVINIDSEGFDEDFKNTDIEGSLSHVSLGNYIKENCNGNKS